MKKEIRIKDKGNELITPAHPAFQSTQPTSSLSLSLMLPCGPALSALPSARPRALSPSVSRAPPVDALSTSIASTPAPTR